MNICVTALTVAGEAAGVGALLLFSQQLAAAALSPRLARRLQNRTTSPFMSVSAFQHFCRGFLVFRQYPEGYA